MAAHDSKSEPRIFKISQHERFDRVKYFGIPLRGKWLQEAGFTQGLPVKIRVMPKCIVITGQDINELWQCLEGLSLEPFDDQQQQLTIEWLKNYPNGLMVEE